MPRHPLRGGRLAAAAGAAHLHVVAVAAQSALREAQGAVLVVGQLPDHHGLVAAVQEGSNRHR